MYAVSLHVRVRMCVCVRACVRVDGWVCKYTHLTRKNHQRTSNKSLKYVPQIHTFDTASNTPQIHLKYTHIPQIHTFDTAKLSAHLKHSLALLQCYRMCSLTIECALLLQNVFSLKPSAHLKHSLALLHRLLHIDRAEEPIIQNIERHRHKRGVNHLGLHLTQRRVGFDLRNSRVTDTHVHTHAYAHTHACRESSRATHSDHACARAAGSREEGHMGHKATS
jgi:hypothetical protein